MDQIKDILARAEVLPMSPSLLPKLLPYLGDVNANFDDVVRIISLEQTLTAKLLQICNSAFFGQDEPVFSVADAVNRVGYQSIYLLAAMINGSNSFPTPSPAGIDTCRLWKHSVASAFNSKFVAETAGQDTSLMFTAGLMHDIGKVVIAQLATAPIAAALPLPATAESLANERAALGYSHAEVGAALLEKWQLPPQLVASIRHHHEPQSAADFKKISACVTLGSILSHSRETPALLTEPTFLSALELLKLGLEHVQVWQRQFNESQELIAGMSKLPL